MGGWYDGMVVEAKGMIGVGMIEIDGGMLVSSSKPNMGKDWNIRDS